MDQSGLRFSVQKQPPPPEEQGSPAETSPRQTPARSGCPATGSPHQVNKHPSALPPSLPPVPPGPENSKVETNLQVRVWPLRQERQSDRQLDAKYIGC